MHSTRCEYFAILRCKDKLMERNHQPISLEQIESVSFGDESFKIELIEIFLEQIPVFIDNMRTYLIAGELTALAKEAHTAKSSVLIFDMKETGEKLKNIQHLGEQGDQNLLADLVEQSVTQMTAAADQLRSILKTLK